MEPEITAITTEPEIPPIPQKETNSPQLAPKPATKRAKLATQSSSQGLDGLIFRRKSKNIIDETIRMVKKGPFREL